MRRLIVIAVDTVQNMFAAEAANGECAVFLKISGPNIGAGDMLDGADMHAAYCEFQLTDGVCIATKKFGPMARADALLQVRRPLSAMALNMTRLDQPSGTMLSA